MLRWLKQQFFGGAAPASERSLAKRSSDELWAAVLEPLATGTIVGNPAAVGPWHRTVQELWQRDADQLMARLAPQIAEFHRRYPLEVQWHNSQDLRVVEPLRLTTDELLHDPDTREFVPWAHCMRTLDVETGGTAFHHGCMISDVLELLRADDAPAEIQYLGLPVLDHYRDAELDAFVAELADNPRLRTLEHLDLDASRTVHLQPRHIVRLTKAPWASRLRSLDFTEQMVDWSVDVPAAERHAVWRAMAKFSRLEHLSMYNNFHEAEDVAVFLAAKFPALTHLALGHGVDDPALLDLFATTKSLPNLQALWLNCGPPYSDPAWDRVVAAGVPVHRFGRLVTADASPRSPA